MIRKATYLFAGAVVGAAAVVGVSQTALFTGSSADFHSWLDRRCDDPRRDDSPAYLYIGSSCAELIDNPIRPLDAPGYGDWLRQCAAMRERLADHVVKETVVPAHKMAWHDWKDATVRLALYRLPDASICDQSSR